MIVVCVLGTVAAQADGRYFELSSPSQRAVLAALARDPGQVVAADRLIDVVWREPPQQALVSLRSHVSRLRARLTGDVIAAEGGGYRLTIDPRQVDARQFEDLVAQARSAAAFDTALALWKGEPFGALADHPFFSAEAARLREVRVRAREQRAAAWLEEDRPDAALPDLRALTADDPLRATSTVLLLRALRAAGRQAEAVAVAGHHRRLLRAEGLEPASDFLAAEQQVFGESVAVTTSVDTGRQTVAPRLASVVGRDRQIRHVADLVRRRRLVTLVGPGGVGKTTVATEAARLVDVDVVWVVRLGEIRPAASVMAAVARSVGAPTTEPMERSLRGHLAGRSVLLVLDNAEHVVAGAAEAALSVAGAGDQSRVLVTSRQSLGVDGEVVVDVEPLQLAEAVALFRERASDAGHPIADEAAGLAAEVCRHLDGLPLAIEMAAARLHGLPLSALAERLDERLRLLTARRSDGMSGQRTLWEVIDWSYQLLTPPQRDLLQQLSVFAGEFRLDLVDEVCRVDGSSARVLSELVDRSMVQFDQATGTYLLLEVVRGFAQEQRGGDRDVDRRHLRTMVAVAEAVDAGLRTGDEPEAARRFDERAADMEAAYRYACATGDAVAVGRICAALYVLVYQRLRADVGSWAAEGLAVVRSSEDPLEPAVRALAAWTLVQRDETVAAQQLLDDSPDTPAARYSHDLLADLHIYRGDLNAALHHAAQAGQAAARCGDDFFRIWSLVNVAVAHGYAGRTEQGLQVVARGVAATDHLLLRAWFRYVDAELRAGQDPQAAMVEVRAVVDDARRAGWSMLHGVALVTWSSLLARTSDPDEALRSFADLIRHWRKVGDVTHQWTTLRNVVGALAAVGEVESAVTLLGALSQAPTPTYGGEARRLQATARRLRTRFGDDAFDDVFSTGTTLDQPAVTALVLSVAERPRRPEDG